MIFKSAVSDIEIPEEGIYQHILSNPSRISDDRVIYVDSITNKKLTYGELKSNSKKFAAGLIDKTGFKRGDVLAIFSPNQIDYPIVSFGTIAAGGKVTFVNPMYTVRELIYQLKDSGAKHIVVFPSFLPTVIKAADAMNIPRSNILLFGNEEISGIKPYSSIISWREADPVEYSPEEAKSTTAYLCYSSGTTGKSKGVETTHFNMVANLTQICAYEDDIGHDTIHIGVLPFFHIYGLCILVHLPILKGATVVIAPKFELSRFCQIIQDYKITLIPVVPPMLISLVKNPIVGRYDLSSLKSCKSGAAPLSWELAEEFTKLFNIPVKQVYGLTETSPATHIVIGNDIVPGSVGKIIPNVECKIISDNGKELGYNQPGELYVRGPNIMKGYLNNKEATDACIDSQGWFHTGDVATIDESGNFFIVDRVKELIKYKGFQVPPAELESILQTHPSVVDAAVIGVYSKREETEHPTAFVVLQQNIRPSDQLKKEIKDFVAKKVVNYKTLRGGVFFIDQIPRSPAGKILRKILKDKVKTEDSYYRAKL